MNEIVSLAEIWYRDEFEYAEFDNGVHFFCFRPKIPILGKFGKKNQKCQLKPKFGA